MEDCPCLAPLSFDVVVVGPGPLDKELLRVGLPHLLEVFVCDEDSLRHVLPGFDVVEDSLPCLVSEHLVLLLLHLAHDCFVKIALPRNSFFQFALENVGVDVESVEVDWLDAPFDSHSIY